MNNFILREWPNEEDVLPAIEEIDEFEVDGHMIQAIETLLSMRSDPICAFDPSVFGNADTCPQCGCVVSTEPLVFRQHHDTCAECGEEHVE
jgi:hypothetical protein